MEDRLLYKKLVQRYLDNTATEEELQVFFQLLAQNKLDEHLEQIEIAEAITAPARPGKSRYMAYVYGIAASLLLIIAIPAVYFGTRTPKNPETVSQNPRAIPGGKRAILTLSNGKQVLLNDQQNDVLNGEGAAIDPNRILVYDAKNIAGQVVHHMITTPKGGEYEVQLPDGSLVWINAGTSLRYPTAFTGKERLVELEGEAYFEVAKDASRPFIVQSGQGRITVLGTHFNVRAYKDEPGMKTTLKEGSVLLQSISAAEKLKPGESGIIEKSTTAIEVQQANIEQDHDWKTGLF